MNNFVKIALGILLSLCVAATGYWLGTQSTSGAMETSSAGKAERQILHYRNPMGLPDTSSTPKQDSMGMDYVPVYAGETLSNNQISISTDKVQKLGVKSVAATLRELNQTLRVTGRIEIDERRTYTMAPKFEGWVERLYVNTTGQSVSKGQPLFDVYSPELVSTRREYALSMQGLAALKDAGEDAQASMRQLVDASRARLQNWDIADSNIDQDEVRPHVTFLAPVTGVVLEKMAVQGMRFMPGEILYQIADLSVVWIIAEVPEQDIGQVMIGNRIRVTVDAYPDRSFDGKVDFIYPMLNGLTRTVQVRMEIANPKGLLKPAMFAHVQLAIGKGEKVLTVPTAAVIDSGMRQVVLVRLSEGRFEPRVVKLGKRSNDYIEVLSGIVEGEQVVTSANFLIDAESNLKAALSGMAGNGESVGAISENSFQPPLVMEGVGASTQPENKIKAVSHQGQGTLDAINADGSVSVTHKPIATLGWPGMTMNFALANSALKEGIKRDSAISFEIVQRKPGVWVITKLQARMPLQHKGN